ncbi:hypothetical protein LIA77_08688 [Sarocladium implicatum]|nr:hypothetical protein LIA77_08688 [Sarocladium implicatum]
MGRDSQENAGLLSDDEVSVDIRALKPSSTPRRLRQVAIAASVTFNIVSVVLLGLLLQRVRRTASPSDLLYSPAHEAISHQVVRFHDDAGNAAIYQQEPSPEVDEAWDDLYRWVAVTRITEGEAAQLRSPTLRIPTDPDNFVVGLDVFHQLHCLNGVRKLLHPEYYDNSTEPLLTPHHAAHCVEMIRQVLVCHADTSPLLWTWDDEENKPAPLVYNDHTCRDFGKIHDWAWQHRLHGDWAGESGVNPGDSSDLR